MDIEQLKALWARLGGSANQNLPEGVFVAAAAYAEHMDYEIELDPDHDMDNGDLYYQQENTQILTVISLLQYIAAGGIPNLDWSGVHSAVVVTEVKNDG
jgi:hypothetical protein